MNQPIFWYPHKNESAVQIGYELLIEISGNQKEQYLENIVGIVGHPS